MTVIQVMLRPFSKGFRVTPKGAISDSFTFNWQLAFPLMAMFLASAISLWINLGASVMYGMMGASDMPPDIIEQFKGLNLGLIFSIYNLLMLGVSLLILFDAPRPSPMNGLSFVEQCDSK